MRDMQKERPSYGVFFFCIADDSAACNNVAANNEAVNGSDRIAAFDANADKKIYR